MKPALYVHIPFCNGKCDYCDFYSLGRRSREKTVAFCNALVRQLYSSCENLKIRDFSTVYIGGGTPSSLEPESLETIFSAIGEVSSSPPCEWTVEVNPESLRREHLELFSSFPVTRVSMGVQSLCSASREFLGRRGSLQAVYNALDLLRENWRGEISVDLIRGLPEKVSLPLEEELFLLPLVEIQHLSLYDLTIERGTPLAMRESILEARRDDLPRLIQVLGFEHYEVSNYARPGKESRHNQSYWDMEPYLGIGPGAVSLLYVKGTWMHQSIQRNLDLYLGGEVQEYTEVEIPSMEEFFIEHLFMGLRQVRGISLNRLEARFGRKIFDIIPRTLDSWTDNLAIDTETGRLSLHPEAFWIQDRFFLDAWKELEDQNPFA